MEMKKMTKKEKYYWQIKIKLFFIVPLTFLFALICDSLLPDAVTISI
jgi:hypothetical protein